MVSIGFSLVGIAVFILMIFNWELTERAYRGVMHYLSYPLGG